MRRLWLGVGIAGCGAVVLLALAAIWHRPAEGGDATTDRAEDAADEGSSRRREFTPVPLDDPEDGALPARISTDPALDTGGPARASEDWL